MTARVRCVLIAPKIGVSSVGRSLADPRNQQDGRFIQNRMEYFRRFDFRNGYLNQVQSSRRLEREAGRNLEVMWLTGRLAPDHKTIADFRKDNGPAIRKVCAQFVELCRKMGLLTKASVAIDGSKFKAVNSRDNNFTNSAAQASSSVRNACFFG
jgi:hypothetical protein